jgi:hypothetical protein
MKKTIAREFLWLVINLVLAAPLSFLFLNSLDLVAEGDVFTENEQDFIAELFLLIYVFNLIGLYLLRFIVLAIKVLSTKDTKK